MIDHCAAPVERYPGPQPLTSRGAYLWFITQKASTISSTEGNVHEKRGFDQVQRAEPSGQVNLLKIRLSIQIENVRRKCCERPYSTISSMASVLNKPPHEPRSSPGYIVERAECAHPCALNRRILRRLCRNLNRREPHVSRPLHPAGRRFVRGGSQQHPVLRRQAHSELPLSSRP